METFKFSEEYQCWDGVIEVKPFLLSNQKDTLLYGTMDSESPILSEEVARTVCYIQENFETIHETILKTVLELNAKGIINETCELDDPSYNSFRPITFSTINEIPKYLGQPTFELLANYKKEDQVYFTIKYQDDCFLSIEHGLNFLFFKDELITWEAYLDSVYIAEKLEHYEIDCTKWKKDFWKVYHENWNPYEDNRNAIREKWL